MAKQAMGYTHKVIADEVNILNRAEFEGTAMTLDSTAFTNNVCKAGAPIDKDGKVANNGNCIGILLKDVKDTRPQGTLVRKGYVKESVITSNFGSAIASAAKAVLPMIIFE